MLVITGSVEGPEPGNCIGGIEYRLTVLTFNLIFNSLEDVMPNEKAVVVAEDLKGWDFFELYKERGIVKEVTEEDGTIGYEYDEDIVTELFGDVSSDALQKFAEGWSNPSRGKTFNGIAEVFEIETAMLKAFLKWRKEKWDTSSESGNPEDDVWDDVNDWKGAYYEVPAEEDEETTDETADETTAGEGSDEEFFNEESELE